MTSPMALHLQFRVFLNLDNFNIASRRLRAIGLSSQSISSSLMSSDAQFVLVESIAQVLEIVSAQIDLISISEASASLSTLKSIQVVFTTSYYSSSNATLSYISNMLSKSQFLFTLQSNAISYSASVANAYASVNVSSVSVEQTYPLSPSSQTDSTTLIVAIVVSIGGFLAIFGLCSFIYLRYLSNSYNWRHMAPLNELINEDADLGASRRV